MSESHDVTGALLQALSNAGKAESEIESIRHATVGLEHLPALIEDPKSIVKAIGVPVQDHSQWHVSVVKRPDTPQVALRRIIVVIVHYRSCSGVIVVFY